jgi:hypothetical protein
LIQALDRSAPILPLLRTSFDEFERSAMQHRDELGALALGEVADRLAGRDAAVREDTHAAAPEPETALAAAVVVGAR